MSARKQLADQKIADRLPILCLVTDIDVAGGSIPKLADTVHDAVSGGVNMVQVRIPAADENQFRQITEAVAEAVNRRALLIANIGRRAIPNPPLPVDGLHFPESDTPRVSTARQLPAYSNAILGHSAHYPESAAASKHNAADYVIIGTIFPSETHPDGQAQGIPLVKSATIATGKPIIAIGGITATNAASAIHAGASGIAVIRSVANAGNPKQAASELSHVIQQAWHDRP